MELTHNDVKSIIGIIDHAQQLDEIELVFAGFRLHVRRGGAGEAVQRAMVAAPVSSVLASKPQPALTARQLQPLPASQIAIAENEVAVRSPMVGTFYHAASPGEKPFVKVGQRVNADDSVGVIEVMKLFNTIRAGVEGTVVRIEVEYATLVEFDQPLIVIARA